MRRPIAAAAAAVVLAGAALGGCGGSSRHPTTGSRAPAIQGFSPSAIYARDAPGVVTVISVYGSAGVAGTLPNGGQGAQGSGFVLTGAGEIVTNAHVVTNNVGGILHRAKAVYVQFADGNEVPAQIVGTDANSDIALLRVNPAGLSLRPLTLGSSAHLVVGAAVAALGSPFGEAGSMSVGVISATNRSIQSLNGTGSQTTFSIPGVIQTDAAINHGNSGGPLVDASGEVIGINSQIASSNGAGEGVGFAVPVDTVKRSVAQLRAHGSVAYAYVGVTTVALFPQLARRLHLGVTQGAYVQTVAPGGPAARVGLRGGSARLQFDAAEYEIGGDVITRLDGRALTLGHSLNDAIALLDPGRLVTLEVWRGGALHRVRLRLGTRPGG
jgi:S1-C subfamily serine protease